MKCPNCNNEIIVTKDNGKLYCCNCEHEWFESQTECWRIYFEEVKGC